MKVYSPPGWDTAQQADNGKLNCLGLFQHSVELSRKERFQQEFKRTDVYRIGVFPSSIGPLPTPHMAFY
jgi:hypothetical protein